MSACVCVLDCSCSSNIEAESVGLDYCGLKVIVKTPSLHIIDFDESITYV